LLGARITKEGRYVDASSTNQNSEENTRRGFVPVTQR